MFPISDSAKTKGIPIFNFLIIAANIYVFYLLFTSQNPESIINQYALIPSQVDIANPASLFPFLTSAFLHGGFLHIISNLWFLWIFGDNVEGYLGHLIYPIFYIVGALGGSLLQYFFNSSSDIPMIGASGAVSAVLGAYYILFPHSKVKTFVLIFIFFTIIEIPAVIYLFYWFALQLFSGVASFESVSQQGGVAFWAHIGGFITGILIARAYKNEKEKGYIEGEIV